MPYLLVTDREGKVRFSPIEKARIILGRRPENDVILDYPGISRQHADIRLENDKFFLSDLGSTNGTFISGSRITKKVELANDTVFVIGPFSIRFLATAADKTGVQDEQVSTLKSIVKPQLVVTNWRNWKLVDYLKRAKEMEASDLHMIIGSSPFVRLKEQILYFDQPPLTQEMIEHFMGEIMSGTMYADFLKNRDIDFSYELPSVARFRVNVCAHHNGYAMTFRIIPFKVPDITKLSLPPLVKRFSKYQDGIVLFTGPGRCGKSSTMASLVETINMERRNHIIILEDPIEFVYEEKLSTITQRQVHLHTESYSTAVRAALRESPDVLVIGELRDLDTISTALSAAETGHLVFATLHTHNAIQTIDRLIDSFPSREQQQIRTALSETLRGVVSQFLIPSADGSRLLPVMEILFVTAAISNLIRENKTYQIVSSIQLGKKYEMKLLDDSLEEYAKDGLITEFQAMAYAQNPDRFIGVS